MNVTAGFKKLKDLTSGDANGTHQEETVPTLAPITGPKQALAVAVLIALAVAVVAVPRRRGGAAVLVRTAGAAMGKAKGKRRTPRSAVRYYGLGLLIGALERDVTRKAAIATLKLARKRA